MVVTDISLVGWLISNVRDATMVIAVVAVLGIVLITTGVLVLHRQIERRIDQVGKL